MQRRQIFKTVGGLFAAVALPPMRQETTARSTDITARLARYMAPARNAELPPEVMQAAKHAIRVATWKGLSYKNALCFLRRENAAFPRHHFFEVPVETLPRSC